MRRLINDVVRMVHEGWRPYDALPDSAVYERLNCPHAEKKGVIRPYWFTRADVFCCIGCNRACCLQRPQGFPPPLPINYPEKSMPYTLTPQEMISRKALLNVDEAAYCLNVSVRHIYTLISMGQLIPLKDRPIRVSTADVKELMEDFDE